MLAGTLILSSMVTTQMTFEGWRSGAGGRGVHASSRAAAATTGRAGAALAEQPPAPVAPVSRPNVLLLVTDDAIVRDLRALPVATREIGDAGTTFTRAFSPYPLCCPARATLLTGQLAHNHGVLSNEPPRGGVAQFHDRETLPVWLQRVGYHTGLIGKYLNGYPRRGQIHYVPPGWTDWEVPVAGTYNYVHRTVNVNGRLRRYHQWQAAYVRDRTVALIRRFARSPQPFFIWSNFLAPHAGAPREPGDPRMVTPAVAPRYRHAFPGARVPRTPALNEADMSDKVGLVRRRAKKPLRVLDNVERQRLRSLLSVDDAVRGILAALASTGQAGNTLVVLTSDNGYLLGQHRVVGKVFGYEESIGVPLLVRGPGMVAGVRRSQVVSLADIPATIVAAAGARATLPADGISLLPLSRDPAEARDRVLLLEAGGRRLPPVHRLYTGVRTGDDKVLLRWRNGFEEVYDLRTDPYELNGRISGDETRYVGMLRAALAALRSCSGAACSSVRLPPLGP